MSKKNIKKHLIKILIIIFVAILMLITVGGCSNNYGSAKANHNSSKYYLYDYYYYPNWSVYYHVSTGYYHYHDGRRWLKVRLLPSRFILDSDDRIRIRLNSNIPYTMHHKHRARFTPRPTYTLDRKRDLIERKNNKRKHRNHRK